MAIDHITSSLIPQASGMVNTIHTEQLTEKEATFGEGKHLVSSVFQPIPKALASKPLSSPITFIPLAFNPALKATVTHAQLAEAQQEKIDIALTLLKAYSPADSDTIKVLENLKASVDKAKLSDQAPTKAFIDATKTLTGTLTSLLIKAGIPEDQARVAFSGEITFHPIALNPAIKTITTQAQLAQIQSEQIDMALKALKAYAPEDQVTEEILTHLKASVDPAKLSHPDQMPTKASLDTAKDLPAALTHLLTKANVPSVLVQEAFADIPQLSFPSTTSNKMLAQLQTKQIEAALIVLKAHDEADRINLSSESSTKWRKFNTAIQTLEHLQKSILQSVAHKGETEATPMQLRMAKKTEKDLMALLASQTGESETTLRAQWRAELTLLQNEQPWEPIHTSFKHQGVTYHSDHTPAGKLVLGEQLLLPDYKGKGISSATTKESQHAANLWASTFSTDSHVLFKGVRHAILSPFGLKKGSKEREEGAINRAKEVVIAALALDPDKLTQALQDKMVDLRLASTSLVTATELPISQEGAQIADQVAAWQKLSAEPFTVNIPDAQGHMQSIQVNLKVAAFNFGVNEIALKLGPFGLGWKQADTYNAQAFPFLIGSLSKGAPIGGWAGDFLATASKEDRVLVEALVNQIRNIWANNLHHYDANEPYKMATRVAVLAHMIGVMPAWNCKSGKDRTGMLDVEIKNMLIQLQEDSSIRAPGATFSEDDKALYREALANTGNLEIQQYNTGVQGNKVLTTHFSGLSLLKERIDSADYVKAMHGLSFLVKA
jgi:phosphatidylinositol-4,5-bisphosphate 4-phosphatase